MDRIHSYEYMEEQINNSQTMTNSEKEDYLKTYKTNYYAWLDELKNKLDNYQPLFNDLDTRRSVSPSFNYSEHNLKGEIWKEFPIDKDYTVSNLGRIKYQGKIQKQKDEKIGYVTLADENLRKDYVYNFVAYTFLGKIIGDGYHVHHITNDGYYNTVDNLVLLTKEEHSYVHGFEIGGKYMTEFKQIINGKINEVYSLEGLQKELKPIKEYPFQNTIDEELDGEQWNPYKNLEMIKGQYNKNHYIGKEYHNIKEMKVSNFGRVKVTYDDNKKEILHQSDDIEIGYLRLPKFPGFGNVYRLVAETWLEKDNDERNIVHHIDNDGYNNKAENLIWVTAEEHAKIHS